MTKPDGGPAFPSPSYADDWIPGMSLRDWFAGHYEPTEGDVTTMCLILFKHLPAGCDNWPMICRREARAHLRYYEADAMLKERK